MDEEPITNPFDEDETKGRQTIIWALLGIIVIGCGFLFAGAFFLFQPDARSLYAQYFPSPTATNTRTPTPTQTPTQTTTPTPDAFLTAISQADPIFEDNFDSNQNNWESNFGNNSVYVLNGSLSLRSNEDGYVGIAYCKSCPNSGDTFFFQANVTLRNKSSERIGLAFCLQPYSRNYYTFSISQEYDKFDLFKHTSRGWETLLRNKSTPPLNKHPNSNNLGVYFDHGEIKLYINNIMTYSYRDEKEFSCDRLGFFVDGGLFSMQADDVVIYKNHGKSPTP